MLCGLRVVFRSFGSLVGLFVLECVALAVLVLWFVVVLWFG